jgi:hypothetical protein
VYVEEEMLILFVVSVEILFVKDAIYQTKIFVEAVGNLIPKILGGIILKDSSLHPFYLS